MATFNGNSHNSFSEKMTAAIFNDVAQVRPPSYILILDKSFT